ncbi:MAG: hypothetical protein C4521_10285 [Actinobacteria bacterium]|nr:MAG: hypothetical protein C4521_10285 [Actinomycetota bacterium]
MVKEAYDSPKTYPPETSHEAYAACLETCHDSDGPAGSDIATYYASSVETAHAGHRINYSTEVVESTASAYLPAGSAMPCWECHNPHGSTRGNFAMAPDELSGSQITNARGVCTRCHREYDSAESTPTVAGMTLKKLPATVSQHSSAGSAGCAPCHGGNPHKASHHGGGAGGVECAECHGTTGSHAVHVSATDPRGPRNMTCSGCHDSGDFPYFASGTDSNSDGKYDLDETDVCDTCHSPGGDYNGVETVGDSVGAKDNWASRVYETTTTIQAGKEKWCAGCHDKSPSEVRGVSAPNVVGDEGAATGYGTGYGFYKTGHGLRLGLFPASEAPAAGVECAGCHDFSRNHMDSHARTYSAASDNYQDGYRLRSIGGQEPMDVPRIRTGPYSGTADAADSRLCYDAGCHDSDLYVNPGNLTTNFRESTYNSHELHMRSGGDWPNRWDSDWDGSGDSFDNCTACHNVHGSSSPAMVRHGELVSTPGTTDKVPALNFKYTTGGVELYPTRSQSNGGRLDLPGGGGSVGSNGVCSMCHNQQVSYSRTPTDFYPPRIVTAYGKAGCSTVALAFTKGVYTNSDGTGALVENDLALTDLDDMRTITGVNHAAGDAAAQLTLSSAFDASSDVGVDAVAAATSGSIFDAGGLGMDTGLVTILADETPPTLSERDPDHGATDVPRNQVLTFTLGDSAAGVDWTTFSISLVGDKGYSKTYTDLDTPVVSKSGTQSSYSVTVDPDTLFSLDEQIVVTVNAADLLGNALTPPAWSFTTEAAPTPQTVTLAPSGLGSNPGGYWTVPVADQWATYLDTNDGDTAYATSNTGAEGATLYMAMDDGSLEGATIQSIQFHVLARYVSGWSPDPPSYPGNIDIGYQTGAATQWEYNAPVPGSGSYIDVASGTYLTDSDGGVLDVTDITNLQIGIKRRTSGAYPLRITQVYAVITYLPGEP